MLRRISISKRRRPAMRRAIRRFVVGADGIAGAAAAEFVIIAPLMVLMFAGLLDLGLLAFSQMQVQHAAQVGAQYVMYNGYPSASAVQTAVESATSFAGLTGVS